MPITEAARRKRHATIGASEVAAILGRSPFATAKDVYLSKRFDLYGVTTEEYYASAEKTETEAQRIGNALENVLLAMCAEDLGVKIVRNHRRRRGIFTASLDAQIKGKKEHIEATDIRVSLWA